MLINSSIDHIDNLVRKLSVPSHTEDAKWMSLAIALDLADELLKVMMPENGKWLNQLNRDTQHTGALPEALPLDTFKNKKQVTWFKEHPNSKSARSAFKLFYDEDCALESNFFWFSESATKQKISAATEYSANWEDSDLTRRPEYKVGIDFFLTPDTNKLLLVLSNHYKLRVLELHEHLSNTQKQIIKNYLNGAAAYSGIKDGQKEDLEPQRTIHTTLWNALQLKEVNKQFYGYIAGHFTELVSKLEEQGKSSDDAKQFSSRLLGRLLFVWFLRKMEIINESMGYFDVNDLSATDYYNQKLKVLFFKTLNTEVDSRETGDLVTPYLNGGLFEAKENDFADELLEFPEGFFVRLYNHFNEFNFTTDESSADFELVAVDPEMLGQVFESLLASQTDEADSNERNNTGSFYTPREIVGYMVKETLRQYLYTKIDKVAHKGIDELLDSSDYQWLARKSTSKVDVWGVNSKRVISKIKTALDNFKVIDPAAGSGAFPMGMMQQLLKTYERIGTDKDSYNLKLQIIENNIYGVDLQPMAVEISRLRAWLSVIVDETNKEDVKPLPNLDFKFVAANSLVKLADGQTSLFGDPDLDIKLETLRDKFFNARKAHTKKEYQEKYYKLTFGQLNMFDDERTHQLRSFDPFKNRTHADFFDPHVMFGVDEFDAVIGNPPYIHFEKMDVEFRNFYKKRAKNLGFETYAARGDIYTLFYEKGISLLKKDGILAYITSNKWMRAKYGEKLRNFFVDKTNPIRLVDMGAGVFESATVDTNILIVQNSSNKHELQALTYTENQTENMSDYIRQHAVAIDYKLDESWIILSEIEQSIKKKIEAVGTPLKDWDIKINRGILTGLNEAFIISKEKRDELIKADPKSAEIIRPILRGRDIRRYEVDFQNLYLINTHNGYVSENGEVVPPINIEDYPAIKDWLDNGAWNKKIDQGTNIERLAKRTDQGVTPYNLRSLAYMDDFLLPKIVWSDISTKPQFALIDKHILINNTAYMITRIHPGAIHILNSRLMKWYFTKISSDLGVGSRYFKQFVELLPLPLFLENKNFYDTLSEDNTEEKLSKFYHLNQAEIRIINQ